MFPQVYMLVVYGFGGPTFCYPVRPSNTLACIQDGGISDEVCRKNLYHMLLYTALLLVTIS